MDARSAPRRSAARAQPAEAGERAEGTVLQGGRRKAYRPLDPQARRAALDAALAAYARGDFFEAHELLEPAWMGTADAAERALYQGLIKLAAGYVHWVRGNPLGMRRNLEGARGYLAEAEASDSSRRIAAAVRVDLARLVAAIDERLTALQSVPQGPPRVPGSPRFTPHDPVRDVPDAPTLR